MDSIDFVILIVICTFILWLVYAFGHVQGMREAYRKMECRAVRPPRLRHIRNVLDAEYLFESEKFQEK